MKKQYVGSVLLTALLFQTVGCSKQSTSITSGNIMSGVAATGAPISGGKVEVKGSDGDIVEDTTESDGSYSADVSDLTEPYLVRVISPTGEKYISVASASDLAEGKKVNVTPLTHIIVANVFAKADADDLFLNFETESGNFTQEKLATQKDELVQKFIAAGLLGSGKIAGADVDLLNGEFVAGTSVGIDGLLDVISVNTDASAGIEVKLKGVDTVLITDKVDGITADPVISAIDTNQLTAAKEQLSVLDVLRNRLNALAALHSSKVGCNGTPVDDGGACDIDTLYESFLPFFHPAYQEDGLARGPGVWGWFCRIGEDDEATNRDECYASGNIKFENVFLKDISLIHYNDVDKVALINFNLYFNGALKGSEEIALKFDGISYSLLGNMKTFEYWIETESLHSSVYNKTANTGVDKYSVNLKFYLNDDRAYDFVGSETFTLTAVSGHQIFPGNLATMPLYMVVAPKYDGDTCVPEVTFSVSATPYKMFNNATGEVTYADFATACAVGSDPCNCRPDQNSWAHFEHDVAQKVELTLEQIARMDKVERITLVGGNVAGDSFVIRKPLVINQFNAPGLIPSFGMSVANFCETATFSTPLNLSVVNGTLGNIHLHQSFSDATGLSWKNESVEGNYWEDSLKSVVFTPVFETALAGDVIRHSHLYLSASDEFDHQFVRQVSCEEQHL